MTFQVPDYAFGDGRALRISASDIAGRRGPFTCRMGLALNSRNKVSRLHCSRQPQQLGVLDDAVAIERLLDRGVEPVSSVVRTCRKATGLVCSPRR